jgi:broad specificity phosphatase PhoE
MRLFAFARHGGTTYNVAGRVNGDPSIEVPLTSDGRTQAALLGLTLAQVPIDLAVHTRFGRTVETLRIALGGRDVPTLEEPGFDDIDVGDLEGEPVDQYRAWKAKHTRDDAFPGGESLNDAARRYAAAARRLLAREEHVTLVVCHDIPVRYLVNAAEGSGELDGPHHAIPNATAFLFSDDALARAAGRIEELAA